MILGLILGAVLVFICFIFSLEITFDITSDHIIMWYTNTKGERSYKILRKK
jgi:hypothetical protein